MLQFYGQKRAPALWRTCYYLMRVVRLDRQTRPALVPIRDKSHSPLTSKPPKKLRDCASAPLATPHKPPNKSPIKMRAQRGAPAPLPHCGHGLLQNNTGNTATTRGAGAPPSLRPIPPVEPVGDWVATRGAGAPPSLRRVSGGDLAGRATDNEGRRRPSLIAARVPCLKMRVRDCQRGAPAPLPHCGPALIGNRPGVKRATRGAGAPPSLRLLDNVHDIPHHEQRGAPAPLPHCGIFPTTVIFI